MRVPVVTGAVLEALRLEGASTAGLLAFSERQWKQALDFCDLARLTLILGPVCGDAPQWVRERLARNRADNIERRKRLVAAYDEIAGALRAAGIDFVALKGFTYGEDYAPDPLARVQYDIDLLCEPHAARQAQDILRSLGYEPIEALEEFPTDHLPAMVRKTGWEWRGNFFDPDLEPSVDVHFRLWDARTEGFPAPGVEQFFARRHGEALHEVDAMGYAALHALRHLLRGSLQASHIYEIACFLDRRGGDREFWRAWRELHPSQLRHLETLIFLLAGKWFACRIPAAAAEEARNISDAERWWLSEHAFSPLAAWPNKNELWLHLCLLASTRARLAALARRLAPARLPGPVAAVRIPDDRLTWRIRARRRLKYAAYLASRAIYHARALVPTLWNGAQWLLRAR